MKQKLLRSCLAAAFACVAADLPAQRPDKPAKVRIVAFECTSPCTVMTYDAKGRPLASRPAPAVGANGLEGTSHGPGFVRLMLDGQEVYFSRMDVHLDKGLVGARPGVVPCRPQTGTMGSGC
jgi:hypothetical protein